MPLTCVEEIRTRCLNMHVHVRVWVPRARARACVPVAAPGVCRAGCGGSGGAAQLGRGRRAGGEQG